jgi:hypothetical protein
MDHNSQLNVNDPSLDINSLYNKYKDNIYILNRLKTHLINLPNMLENENKKYEERISRISDLTMEQENFYKVFLSKHQYYYMPYNNIYYQYNGKTYTIIKEDDIHHHLLSTITEEGKLMVWKHKTKQNIIKRIKERILLKSIPETYTIQNILGFLNTIFETKTESQYFLTIIGDCILKKTNVNDLIFFINSNTKKLVSAIDSIAYITTGNSIMNNFISKYHDTHNLSYYRLIKTNENSVSTDLIKVVLNNIGIDLLCVAAHYSDRYNNSDSYLNTKSEEAVKNYALFFSMNNINKIINDFVGQCVEPTTNNSNMSWKNMHYIWKLYLSNINVPNILYSNNLKVYLKNLLLHEDTEGSEIAFINVTSKFLPSVSNFLSFWEKHVSISQKDDDEYEIEELSTLYKLVNKNNNMNIIVSEQAIIKMIIHYFSPQVEVIDNKYITNIRCTLWNKQDDIIEMLSNYKSNGQSFIDELISLDELYNSYNSYYKAKNAIDKTSYYIVSKQYFEKFVAIYLCEYIKFDKFVSSSWIKS